MYSTMTGQQLGGFQFQQGFQISLDTSNGRLLISMDEEYVRGIARQIVDSPFVQERFNSQVVDAFHVELQDIVKMRLTEHVADLDLEVLIREKVQQVMRDEIHVMIQIEMDRIIRAHNERVIEDSKRIQTAIDAGIKKGVEEAVDKLTKPRPWPPKEEFATP